MTYVIIILAVLLCAACAGCVYFGVEKRKYQDNLVLEQVKRLRAEQHIAEEKARADREKEQKNNVIGCMYKNEAYYMKRINDMKWDYISADLTLEKETENLKLARNIYAETLGRVAGERDALQEKLSAALCPKNDHIWNNGRCKRCGAWREDFAIIGESFIKAGPKPSVSEVRKDAE